MGYLIELEGHKDAQRPCDPEQAVHEEEDLGPALAGVMRQPQAAAAAACGPEYCRGGSGGADGARADGWLHILQAAHQTLSLPS
jgi:hypothetical protein